MLDEVFHKARFSSEHGAATTLAAKLELTDLAESAMRDATKAFKSEAIRAADHIQAIKY